MEEKDQNIVAIDRIHKVLEKSPQGLSIQEIATICGLEWNTVYQKLRRMFHLQEVVEVRSKNQRLFRLAKHDIAIASPEKSRRRSLSE